MIIRYGRVVCRNFQSVRLEVEEEFDSNKWSYGEGLCAVKAIVFAALRLPVPQYEKAKIICKQALDIDLADLIKQQELLAKAEKEVHRRSYCFTCEDFTIEDSVCIRCKKDLS